MCLKLLVQGKTAKEIAQDMHISYRTVEDYIAKTIELLGCTSSKELIALYYEQP
jgi:shikimate kinase